MFGRTPFQQGRVIRSAGKGLSEQGVCRSLSERCALVEVAHTLRGSHDNMQTLDHRKSFNGKFRQGWFHKP